MKPSRAELDEQSLLSQRSSMATRMTNIEAYKPVLEHISTLEQHIQHVISLTQQLILKKTTIDAGSFELEQLYSADLHDEQEIESSHSDTLTRLPSYSFVKDFQAKSNTKQDYRFRYCCRRKIPKNDESLPSLRSAVDLMFAALIEFLYANKNFICCPCRICLSHEPKHISTIVISRYRKIKASNAHIFLCVKKLMF